MSSRSFLIGLLLLLFVSAPANSQTVASKDPTALKLLSAAVSALAGSTSISDVTLTATVTRTAGSDVETGSATLEALGGVDSRVNLALTNGQQSEITNQSTDSPGCQWSGTDARVHAMPSQNCWVPASWFFPALALAQALNDPSIAITYAGQENRNGRAVQHIHLSRVFSSSYADAATVALLEHLATADAYLDASNFLPVALQFNIHPDNNAGLDIPVEIQYGNFESIGGVLLPAHIEKLINGSLFLDFNVTGAATNTSPSQADFAVTASGQ